MSIGRAQGYPDYTATGTANYIPELYSATVLEKWYLMTCLQKVTTNKYIGEIKAKGDAVYVRTRPTITISDFVNDQSIVWQNAISDSVKITVDNAKYFAFKISDITDYQSDINLLEQDSMDAAEQMKIAIENVVFSAIDSQAHASNIGATAGAISGRYNLGTSGAPVTLSASNMINYIAYAKGCLDEQNVPDDGNRFIILPSWGEVEFSLSDAKNASFLGGDKSILVNGMLQQFLRFNVFMSNNLETATDGSDTVTKILFGHPNAICYADNLVKTEMFDQLETTFGKGMKGLHVFGYKVVKPEGLGYIYAKPPAIT